MSKDLRVPIEHQQKGFTYKTTRAERFYWACLVTIALGIVWAGTIAVAYAMGQDVCR